MGIPAFNNPISFLPQPAALQPSTASAQPQSLLPQTSLLGATSADSLNTGFASQAMNPQMMMVQMLMSFMQMMFSGFFGGQGFADFGSSPFGAQGAPLANSVPVAPAPVTAGQPNLAPEFPLPATPAPAPAPAPVTTTPAAPPVVAAPAPVPTPAAPAPAPVAITPAAPPVVAAPAPVPTPAAPAPAPVATTPAAPPVVAAPTPVYAPTPAPVAPVAPAPAPTPAQPPAPAPAPVYAPIPAPVTPTPPAPAPAPVQPPAPAPAPVEATPTPAPVFDPTERFRMDRNIKELPFHPSNPESVPRQIIFEGQLMTLARGGAIETDQIRYNLGNDGLLRKTQTRNISILFAPQDSASEYDSYSGTPTYKVTGINIRSPLVLDLNGDGIETTERNHLFDLEGNGNMSKISGLGKDDALLVFDPNNNGIYGETGLELFGNSTDIHGTGQKGNFANGFDALRAYAALHLGEAAVADNVLDANELRALEERAGLRLNVDGETKTLSEKGVTEIRLDFLESDKVDEFGNEFRQISSFVRNGEDREIVDVWFQTG